MWDVVVKYVVRRMYDRNSKRTDKTLVTVLIPG